MVHHEISQEPPFVMFKKDSYQIAGNERFEGFLVDLLRHFSQSLNFDYEIRLASDNKYGTIYVNRFWDGIIGMIHRKVHNFFFLFHFYLFIFLFNFISFFFNFI